MTILYYSILGAKGMGLLSPEIRKLIVRARRNGLKVKEVAKIFNVSRWTVWGRVKRAHHPERENCN